MKAEVRDLGIYRGFTISSQYIDNVAAEIKLTCDVSPFNKYEIYGQIIDLIHPMSESDILILGKHAIDEYYERYLQLNKVIE